MVHLAFDVGTAEIDELVIAGWTGRDVAALEHHIEELKAIGVQPPSSVPLTTMCGRGEAPSARSLPPVWQRWN